ncbi:hypothetical protein GH714_033017 [Hevea brasiliensis]|uniref:Nuclear condensin complex subunit 3 C-terminal domain-containing protein n=1 Tax=Hevea brasiliensis TaxID=3981 RepID=A0A6A6L259_HEVBR|nr:hypothetical protein GH714_033017 [Hevea brasiliensis]
MRDEWLSKCCNDDPVGLLKYLDVETYESVGESVMVALLQDGLVKLYDGQSIRQCISSTISEIEDYNGSIHLMEPEFALYWKTVCKNLQKEAQEKGSDAATTMGTEAALYAAEASDKNDLLERILPATVSDYIVLVKAHIDAGSNYHFASRQLLLLGAMLDYSDSTSRKVASSFVQELLHKPLDHEVDDEGNQVVIGDGINLGGDKEWANAVSSLARKVHAATGEFEEVVVGVIEELARPCRERTADFMQWMHCLAVTGLLLENSKSLHRLQGKAIEPSELLQSLLLPGEHVSGFQDSKKAFNAVNISDADENLNIELLDLLYAGLGRNDWVKSVEFDEMRQCKPFLKCLSKAFVPVMRSMWPGIYGNAGGAASLVSNMQSFSDGDLFEWPIFAVASFAIKKTPAEKSYISALSRILVLLRFRLSEQEAIKLMRRLLNHVAESISAEKDLVKELKLMVERLKSLDKQPDEELSQDQANQILGRLELDFNLDVDSCDAVPQTPAPLQSSKRTRTKRRARCDEQTSSDEETSSTTVVQTFHGTSVRSQRASKTAALSKIW